MIRALADALERWFMPSRVSPGQEGRAPDPEDRPVIERVKRSTRTEGSASVPAVTVAGEPTPGADGASSAPAGCDGGGGC